MDKTRARRSESLNNVSVKIKYTKQFNLKNHGYMRKDNIEPVDGDPMEEYRAPSPGCDNNESSGLDKILEDHEEDCPYFGILMHSILMPKPFGIIWDEDKMIKFLEKRGYKILERHYLDRDRRSKDSKYKVALKPGTKLTVDHSNIREVFDSEIQDLLLSWFEKIS